MVANTPLTLTCLAPLGLQVNSVDFDGWLPLHVACYYGAAKVADMLLRAGSQVTRIGLGKKITAQLLDLATCPMVFLGPCTLQNVLHWQSVTFMPQQLQSEPTCQIMGRPQGLLMSDLQTTQYLASGSMVT